MMEIILTLVIVSIASAIAYPKFQDHFLNKKKLVAAAHSLQIVSDAVRKYESDYNTAPGFWKSITWAQLVIKLAAKGFINPNLFSQDFEFSISAVDGRFYAKRIRQGVVSSNQLDWAWFHPGDTGRATDEKTIGSLLYLRGQNPDYF